jgi:hypothetical protein
MLEAISWDNMHCFIMHLASDEKDTLVIWWMRRLNEKVTKRKYWLHLYINSSGELAVLL